MRLSRRAALDGVYLDEAHEAIIIRGVEPGKTERKINSVARMGGIGQRITTANWNLVEAKVIFAINLKKWEMDARREAFEAACAWALKKGWLTMTGNPGRKLYVNEIILPDSGDLWDWTAEYTITFQAYDVPFWQDETPASVTVETISGGTINIDVPGHVDTVLNVRFENKSGKTINKMDITADGHKFTFTGLGLGENDTLTITHGEDGLLEIWNGAVSLLDKRRGADDLIVRPGNRQVIISAERAGRLTLTAAGRYIA